MRTQLSKLKRGKSTHAERIFSEILKELRIKFHTKQRIGIYEVDFLIGKIIIEINGHEQCPVRNNYFLEQGYTPYHYSNSEVEINRNKIKNNLKCLLQLN